MMTKHRLRSLRRCIDPVLKFGNRLMQLPLPRQASLQEAETNMSEGCPGNARRCHSIRGLLLISSPLKADKLLRF